MDFKPAAGRSAKETLPWPGVLSREQEATIIFSTHKRSMEAVEVLTDQTSAPRKKAVNRFTPGTPEDNRSGTVGERRRMARLPSTPSEALLTPCWRFIPAPTWPT